MNVALNNQLVAALSFLREDEQKYVSQINKYNEHISQINKRNESKQQSIRRLPHPVVPSKAADKQLLSMVLLLIFVWPVGIPYAIYFACTRKKREKKNNEQYVAEMNEYENEIRRIRASIKQGDEEIEEIKLLISKVNIQRTMYYQQQGGCLAFLPKHSRSLSTVKDLYDIIHEEYCYTLEDALILHNERQQAWIELQEEIEKNERAWEEERRAEKRHKELLKTQEDLVYYQQKAVEEQNRTNEELEKIHQDNLRRRY